MATRTAPKSADGNPSLFAAKSQPVTHPCGCVVEDGKHTRACSNEHSTAFFQTGKIPPVVEEKPPVVHQGDAHHNDGPKDEPDRIKVTPPAPPAPPVAPVQDAPAAPVVAPAPAVQAAPAVAPLAPLSPAGSAFAPSVSAPVAPAPAALAALPRAAAAPPATRAAAPAQRPPAPTPAKAPAAPAPAKRMALPRADAAEEDEPYRIFLVGVGGVGKTTFLVNSDAPTILTAEHSPNVPRRMRSPRPETWDDCLTYVHYLIDEPHNFKTLGIDTINMTLALTSTAVLEKAKEGAGNRNKGVINYLSDINAGFGDAGAKALDEELLRLLALLDRLVANRGMNVIITAHAGDPIIVKTADGDYPQWQPDLPGMIWRRLQTWADIAALARYDVKIDKPARGKAKAVGLGDVNVLRLRPSPSSQWVKTRYPLPAEIPLDFDEFSARMRGHTKREIEAIEQRVRDMAAKLAGHTFTDREGKEQEFVAWIESELALKPNARRLQVLDTRLQFRVNQLLAEQSEESAEDDTTPAE